MTQKGTSVCPSCPRRAVESEYRAEVRRRLRPECKTMARYTSYEMGLPPFRGAVRQIILFSIAVFVVLLVFHPIAPEVDDFVFRYGVLSPAHISQGWIWQFVTYAFMYLDPISLALSLLGIYFIGGAVEDQIGSSRFYGLFFGSLILAGIAG